MTAFYLTKNDHQWVNCISLKTITLRPDLVRKDEEDLPALGDDLGEAAEFAVKLHVQEAAVAVHAEHGVDATEMRV